MKIPRGVEAVVFRSCGCSGAVACLVVLGATTQHELTHRVRRHSRGKSGLELRSILGIGGSGY
jgi:hypothetical protein